MAPDVGDEDLDLSVLESFCFFNIVSYLWLSYAWLCVDEEPYRKSHPRATTRDKINMTQDLRRFLS